jgi:hypothetical protein
MPSFLLVNMGISSIFVELFFVVGDTAIQIQGVMLPRQALYHLSHSARTNFLGPPYLCLQGTWDYGCEPLCPAGTNYFVPSLLFIYFTKNPFSVLALVVCQNYVIRNLAKHMKTPVTPC